MARENPEIEKKLQSAVFPGTQGGPLMHVIAAKAVAFKEALLPEFKIYQAQSLANSRIMAQTVMARGFDVVSNGTDNHLFLLNLISKGLTGKAALEALSRANITVNKNAVPNDPQSPFITSGIRIGTPAVTTRGFKEAEAEQLAHWICDILSDINNSETIAKIGSEVATICKRFPVYEQDLY